jgi:hypothetical protein
MQGKHYSLLSHAVGDIEKMLLNIDTWCQYYETSFGVTYTSLLSHTACDKEDMLHNIDNRHQCFKTFSGIVYNRNGVFPQYFY